MHSLVAEAWVEVQSCLLNTCHLTPYSRRSCQRCTNDAASSGHHTAEVPDDVHEAYLEEMETFVAGKTLPAATVAALALVAAATCWSRTGLEETRVAESLEEILEADTSGFPECKRVMIQSASFLRQPLMAEVGAEEDLHTA